MIGEACLAELRAKAERLTRRATALSVPVAARMRGRGSVGPWRLTPRDWIGALVRTMRHAAREDYGIAAGAIAFSSFLALLPLLAVVALAYGRFTAPEQVIENVRALIRILPGSARDFVGDWLVETLTKREGRSTGLLLSAAVTLYGATRAGRSIIAALNIACGLDRRRGFFARRILALAIVLSGGSLLLSALFAISGLAFVERYLPEHTPYVIHALRLAFWIIVTLGAGGALAVIYRHAPARKPPSWRWVAPGALAATGLWLVTTLAFGFYLGSFGAYQQSYGSIGAVVVLQLWLFLSAFILMLGARLNVEAEACLVSDAA